MGCFSFLAQQLYYLNTRHEALAAKLEEVLKQMEQNGELKASGRRTMSTVLLGQRRMGKTEIFLRVVNRKSGSSRANGG